MRISTAQLYTQGVQAIDKSQVEVAKAQQQISSGHRLLSPADDPVASTQVQGLREQIAITAQYQQNITLATGRLSIEDSTLQAVGDVLQRARELAVQGNNAALSASDRSSIAQEVCQLGDQLQGLANAKDDSGRYLFAGAKIQTEPFVKDGAGGIIYQGDQGQRLLQAGPSRQVVVGDSGAEVFQQIRNGNGRFSVAAAAANTGSGTIAVGSVTDPTAFQAHSYRIEFTAADTFDVIDETTTTPVLSGQTYRDGQAIQFNGLATAISGTPASCDRFTIQPAVNQDLFTTLKKLADTLAAPAATPASSAQLSQSLDNTLADLDQGINHLEEVRGRVGARLNALDSQDSANQAFSLHLQQTLSDVDGLDYAEAATRLNGGLVALQAAQQSFVRIQDLSLFNYLR